VDVDDQFHTQAQGELRRLERERLSAVVAFPILLEAYSLVLRRLGLQVAHSWLEEVRDGASTVNPTQEDYQSAVGCIYTYPDQLLTMFDSVLAVLSERLDCPIWTYDYHFDVMQARVWR
jgi:predicted nucleic acid-binding protein